MSAPASPSAPTPDPQGVSSATPPASAPEPLGQASINPRRNVDTWAPIATMIAAVIAASISGWTLVVTRDTQAEMQVQQQQAEGRVRLEQVRTTTYSAYIVGHRRLRDSFDQFLLFQNMNQQVPGGVVPSRTPKAPTLEDLSKALDDTDARFVEVALVADAQGTQAAGAMHDSMQALWTAVFDALVDGNWSNERFGPLLSEAQKAETALINASRAARGLHDIEFR